ncbi:TPA: helix-turn-helix transcriptional regulator [Vibrio parahaemolyticus]|nr:helix-turn-helix transcriptional regulator [Vibrio parahaemolyticus]
MNKSNALEKYVEYITELESDWGEDAVLPIFKIDSMLTDIQARSIGHRISELRNGGLTRSLSQQEFATMMGMQRTIISRMERGDKKALNHLYLVAKTFHIPIKWLILGSGTPYEARLKATVEAGNVAQQIHHEIGEFFEHGNYPQSIEMDKITNELKNILLKIKELSSKSPNDAN